MEDRFQAYAPSLESPGAGGFAITPSNSTDLALATRAIYVQTGGDIKITTVDGSTFTLGAYPGGEWLPMRVTRVWATGTTASGLVGIY